MKRIFAILLFSFVISWSAQAQQKDTLRILAIGNSFSQDSVEQYLWELFNAEGIPVIIGNMYIGGCSLERHFQNTITGVDDYSYRKVVNGEKKTRKFTTLQFALADEPWDYVSFQQASGVSGEYETYEPYLQGLRAFVRRRVAATTIFMWHQTWAYSADATHKEFPRYGKDQLKMYQAIVKTSQTVMKNYKFPIIIPSGTAIQNARNSSMGDVFNRDGYHLQKTYGRYTAACTWFEAISGRSVVGNSYYPAKISKETADICQKAAHNACKHPYKITKK